MQPDTKKEEKVKAIDGTNPNKAKGIVVDFSEKAKANLKKQQKTWMRKKGEKLPIRSLAGRLLENAKA